jgi:hypothetical protein
MRTHSKESGFALILLIGITAALAILAATLVMLLDNQQHATAAERKTKTSLDWAEAALNSAVNACKNDTSWLGSGSTTLTSAYLGGNYPSGGPSVTYLIYDNLNPIDYTKTYDFNGDHEVWIETDTTYLGKVSKVRQLVSSNTTSSILPKAAAYADTDILLSGAANIYGVLPNGLPDTSGAPYPTTIMAGDDITGGSGMDLAAPADGTNTQSLGLQYNGTLTTPYNLVHPPTPGGVGLLSDYFDQAHQAALTAEAQAGMPTQASSTGTTITAANFTPTNLSSSTWRTTNGVTYNGSNTYTFANNVVISGGALTIASGTGKFPSGTIFAFRSLYVSSGDLTLSGNVQVTTTALYVGGNFVIKGSATGSGAGIVDSFGPTYVTNDVDWRGGTGTTPISITTGALFAKIFGLDGSPTTTDNTSYDGSSGPYSVTLGPMWVDGDAGTGDIAVNFSGPSSPASTVMCPLLATTEQTHINGLVNLGTLASPMVYLMQCDNDTLYNNTFQFKGTGTYTGLMVLFEAPFNMTSGTVVGAVLEGTPVDNDITMSGSSSICYNQTAIDHCTSDTLRTTTVTAVPGSWQQLAN